jgi:hypothetical protein
VAVTINSNNHETTLCFAIVPLTVLDVVVVVVTVVVDAVGGGVVVGGCGVVGVIVHVTVVPHNSLWGSCFRVTLHPESCRPAFYSFPIGCHFQNLATSCQISQITHV